MKHIINLLAKLAFIFFMLFLPIAFILFIGIRLIQPVLFWEDIKLAFILAAIPSLYATPLIMLLYEYLDLR